MDNFGDIVYRERLGSTNYKEGSKGLDAVDVEGLS